MKKIISSFLLLLPSLSLAQTDGGLNAAAPSQLRRIGSVPDMANILINAALSLLGVIFIILIILAGFKWMTAQGDSKKVDEAKDNIKNAVTGLIVVLAAYAITTFVFNVLLNEAPANNGAQVGE